MIYLDNKLDFENYVNDTHVVSDNEIILKVVDPNIGLQTSYGVSFQPIITGFSKKDNYSHDSVVVIPLIPQYFHNFFEIFTKLIRLKNLKEDFTVIILFDKNEFTGTDFTFLTRGISNTPQVNAAHMKEFLDYAEIPYECVLDKDIDSLKPKSTYLFFDDGDYMDIDPSYKHMEKLYKLAHFLKVPATHVIAEQLESLRDFFPKHNIINNKRTWASRKVTWDRKCPYEDDLEQIVKDLNYDLVYFEFMTLLEQIQLIQNSKIFGCLYGSGLVNTCFMNEGSKLLTVRYVENYEVDTYKVINRKGVLTHIIAAYPEDPRVKRYLETEIGYVTEVVGL